MMVNAHLVAFVVMISSLCRSDCAQGNDSSGNGENDFLHYKTLKSMLWSYRHSTLRAASTRKHATLRASRVGTPAECVCQCNTTSVYAARSLAKHCRRTSFRAENEVDEEAKEGTNEPENKGTNEPLDVHAGIAHPVKK
jgi:hypothetical protein